MNTTTRDSLTPAEALQRAVELIGSQSATAQLLKVGQSAVSKWIRKGKSLPAEHVLAVENATGLSRHQLRPDLYPAEPASAVVHAPLPHSTQPTRTPAPLGEAVR